jgi:alpha-tubulin suppressor-like RCC1 family protein
VFTWGNNRSDQLGLEGVGEQNKPGELFFKRDSNIVSVFCGCYHTGVITKLGSLYMWGVKGRTGAGRDPRSRQDPPSIKWRGPLWRHEKVWELIVMWLFLGREDAKSNLSRLPIEVIFNFTTVLLDINF